MSQTMGDLERETGQKFNANPRMKWTTWLKRQGFPAAAKLVDQLEKWKP